MAAELNVPSDKIRNVVLLGHTGAGKTSVGEALLHLADVSPRKGNPADGTAVLDFEPEEHDRHHSLSLALATFPWQDHKINLLDAPGGPEAIGDAYPGLLAADVAIFVVDATTGLQPQHEELWEVCERLGLPRLIFLNKLDKENATFQRNVDELRERYGKPVAPVTMPLGVEQEFTGVIDLLHATALEMVDGRRVEHEIPEERRDQAERNRELLVEAIVENEDDLLERYLEGDVPETKELAAAFARAISEGGFFPLLCGSAEREIGIHLLADFIVEECPSPVDRGWAGSPDTPSDGPTALYVCKTLSDPFVGRINLMRVVSGGLKADDTLHNPRSNKDVRLHQLFTLRGKEQLPVPAAALGDLVAVAKLDDVRTGDVLHAKGGAIEMEQIAAPDAYYRVAVHPASAGDEDKLSTALARIAEEDPALRVERDEDTGQLVIRAYGPTHVDVTLRRMQRKFGVAVTQGPPRIAYRETLKTKAQGLGRHVKQSGGHGQFGVAHIEAEPLPRGEGFVFEDAIVGGVIPNQYIPSVEKGVRDVMAKGVAAGYAVVDVKVRLFEGKAHSVDSSDMAFQMAGSLAFRDAADNAGIQLLEPVLEVDVAVPDDLTGDVMGDLSSRRGRIQGTDPAGPGRQMIHALVPEAEMLSYVAELRALTSGRGTAAMRYHHHEEMPDHAAQKVIAAANSGSG